MVWPLLLSALAWGIIFAAIPPARQNFPLCDDWAFSRSAFAFFNGKGIHYFQWASMPQLGQWLWAMPFLAILGPTHFALRISTIVLGWFALLAFYDLLRQAQVPPGRAPFATAVLAFNPWFFLSQGTFMTDVPSLAFALGALALYGRALSQRNLVWLTAAAAVAMLGAITRQNTIAAALVAAVFLTRDPGLRRRPSWWLAVLLPVGIAGCVHLWFVSRADIRPMPLSWPSGFDVLDTAWVIIHTLGLVVLPVLLLDPRPGSWKRFAVALPLLLLAAFIWRQRGELFPYADGILDVWGAFTATITVGARDELLTPNICLFLSVAGCVGAAALLAQPLRERIRAGRLLLLFSLLEVPLLLAVPNVYDRYLEFLMPAGLYLALSTRPLGAGRWILGGAALTLSAFLSIGLMHDWLSWNEARWAVGQRARQRGIDPWDIEGGFEWDGWFAPSPLLPPRKSAPRGRILLVYSVKHFAHVRGHYALSFSVLPHTVAVDSQPYNFWLQPGRRRLYLIKANPPPVQQTKPP